MNTPDQRPSAQPARIPTTHGPVAGVNARGLPGFAVSDRPRFAVRKLLGATACSLPVRMDAPVTGGYGRSVSAAEKFAGGALAVAPITGGISGVPPRGRPV